MLGVVFDKYIEYLRNYPCEFEIDEKNLIDHFTPSLT